MTRLDPAQHRDVDRAWSSVDTPFPELRGLHSECFLLSGEPAQLPEQVRSWWPSRFSSHGEESTGGYRYYRCNEGTATTYVIADAKAGTAYFWRE